MDIFVKSETRLHPEVHNHFCTVCTRGNNKSGMVEESNIVCQKTLRGTGLEFHAFPCVTHMQWMRGSYGLSAFTDALLEVADAERFKEVVPDSKLDAIENGDA